MAALLQWLDGTCRPTGAPGANDRMVIFTEYLTTLLDLEHQLTAAAPFPAAQ
jgi:hypothetical protein